MENEKVKKVDALYMLIFIFAPIVVVAAVTAVLVTTTDGTGPAALVPVVLLAASVAWWVLGWRKSFESGSKKLAKAMDAQGLTRNMTFNGKGCVVVVDTVHGKLGLVYAANPRKQYIIPASRVENPRVDDGKTGRGALEGSMRVSFLFTVDGIKNRVDTFASNSKWKMTDPKILEGISKADSMVEIISAAKAVR